MGLTPQVGFVIASHGNRITVVIQRAEEIREALYLQSVSRGLAALQAFPVAVVDGGIACNGILIVGKATGSKAQANGITLGSGKIQESIVGIEQGDGVGHGGLLSIGYDGEEKMCIWKIMMKNWNVSLKNYAS